jgi:hypothetical protein
MFTFDRETQVAKPEASLAKIFSSFVRAWLATKLCFVKEFGGPMIYTTDISLAADISVNFLICSNSRQRISSR